MAESHEGVHCVACSRNGQIIVSGARDWSVQEWNSAILHDYKVWVGSVQVSCDELLTVMGSTDYTVHVLKMRAAKLESTLLKGYVAILS